ncbi:3-dehydroquinate synthase [Blochmannia endosymbiont of Camponotus (Colobopsis) obliquus]|uniref:3-dehydroquinate synthase n=1 Tax=Blochmannia endosymbiont of Camponotus (Colobopsis) obliquus TaxID=1505597 RepID=UPI00061A7DF9|nr:3-dehydroquinate synthase [Blochmannia endosymbiont of Camponotus (Colobopsis) obliquus]AKC60716.1 3-dehydroquinate synthase [Blochmannia endosymbiont of Camponotus (Colobopsis) obliquus]
MTLGHRDYLIFIGSGLLSNMKLYSSLKSGDTGVIITNDVVSLLYLETVYIGLSKSGVVVDKLVLPDGEEYKTLTVAERVISFLLQKKYDRDLVLIALGGGVIGDLTGFVASIYHRGVRFIQIPTTLLSQVDASIGGKTAVNHALGKNMIGRYHQPNSVVVDFNCLNTLPRREFSSGLAEVIKYAILFDRDFFVWLEDHLKDLFLLKSECLMYCIKRCCELKGNIVEMDECENSSRMLLNLGHTYAHAIEVFLCYKGWLHGEAVSAGIMMAIRFALRVGLFNASDAERVKMLFVRANLPIYGPMEMSPEDYYLCMLRDKKNRLGQLRLVLPIEIGKAVIYDNVSSDVLKSSILI